ncbi:Ig domain-containing protein group 2 domain-containing protein [Catenovulum agarivorans DS-2]|uniref:Ig domain-containing protein group 2 domain-containing protein n=1 Tax=Catenovulum agarivorans DS-2 TaxID=1328313 RepID=W7Q656_9ALTE|nr:CRTAC1 family protein [Catenovulum agarivorans]EWH08254.1 Ig domain-containing protein group 2 domain-containing protein [Catenovulum agarivorans DS-2]
MKNIICYLLVFLLFACSADKTQVAKNLEVTPETTIEIDYEVTGPLTKVVHMQVDNSQAYASISLMANQQVLFSNLDIPSAGQHSLTALIKFNQTGPTKLKLSSLNAALKITSLTIKDTTDIQIPQYQDISIPAGLDKVNSIKYGGPTVADIDNDGDYDFIVNNHNAESSKLYWNNGDGTVTKHKKDLARWFMHDLHGVSAGDYDHDGDLDLIVTQGGGNGKNPSKANFYHNNHGTLVLMTGDVNIKRGGRGRGGFWTDMDLDGDLDLLLINETSLHGDKPQHFAYENLGNSTFKFRFVEGLLNQHPSRTLITDLNNDQIDDIILYSPLSVWQGNGDFTYTEITDQFPKEINILRGILAIADIDIDNDGDLDLYLARGKDIESNNSLAASVDFEPNKQIFSIKPRGLKGTDSFSFTASKDVKLYNHTYLARGNFRGKSYPIFLGKNKKVSSIKAGETFTLTAKDAQGWPEDTSESGVYFGYLGDNQWQALLVRNANLFWNYQFSLSGVESAQLDFEAANRNTADILLRNDNGKFVDVSSQWNIPQGGNSTGVTVGDFNNDSFQDLLVYRWGLIHARGADLMLLNNGSQKFVATTSHGAHDIQGPGKGDMGQAFDFDLDGDLDILSGSEGGEWYLYQNQTINKQTSTQNNYLLTRVAYSPKAKIDPISAVVKLKIAGQTYLQEVGSAGSVFSQSLLNIVHFGLAKHQKVDEITVTWRNGESVKFENVPANQIIDAGIVVTPAKPQQTSIDASQTTAPYVKIVNRDEFENKPLKIGDSYTLAVEYHAGTGNRVIKSDEGGIRFWFRHFKSKWIPVKDVVLVDESAVGSESGKTKMTFKLTGLTPTAELPDGHLYQFRVSFASSNGDMLDDIIYPLSLVE